MPRYLAEEYSASPPEGVLPVRLEGASLIDSYYVPEDELRLYVFECESEADLHRAASAAALVLDRITPVVRTTPSEDVK